MTQAVDTGLPAQFTAVRPFADGAVRVAAASAPIADIALTVSEDLSVVEQDWRRFERIADCTVFQAFDWLATWQRHIGAPSAVTPAIVIGRDTDGAILFILPLAVRRTGMACELAWLGSDLCDYNAPLLAPTFSERFDRERFLALWETIVQRLQVNPRIGFDFINFVKMPEAVGAQANPMLALSVTANPSGAYLTHLAGDWEAFYSAKRSSATRRRDRTKRKRLADFGEIRLVSSENETDVLSTLKILMEQKSRSFARMGVANLFARPGYAAFYRALATDAASRHLVHVSRLEVGATIAAVNIGLTFGDRYYHLQASYDDGEVSRFGPGMAHLHELLRRAIERGYRIYDFTIGDESYKRDWCDTELTLYDHVMPVTWRGMLVAAPMLITNRLKRWIKQTPAAWNAVIKGRALTAALMAKLHRR